MPLPAWHDIRTFDALLNDHDDAGIARSREYFHSLIKAEMDSGIPSSRIVLGKSIS